MTRLWRWFYRLLHRRSARRVRCVGTLQVHGHRYPKPDPGYGNHAEELFFYTSRYYARTERFLAALAGDEDFDMSGYKARYLAPEQRDLLACLLGSPPTADTARAIIAIVRAVKAGDQGIPASCRHQYMVYDG